MVRRARRFARVLLVLIIPIPVFAHGPTRSEGRINGLTESTGGLPPNLDAGAFRPTVELMWRASPTFRGQCARLAGKPRLRVVVRIDSSRSLPAARAHTEISRVHGTVTHADIVVSDARNAVELIAHEVEHVIEQIDGLRVEAVCDSNRGAGAGESCRAIEAGRRVAAEVEENGPSRKRLNPS